MSRQSCCRRSGRTPTPDEIQPPSRRKFRRRPFGDRQFCPRSARTRIPRKDKRVNGKPFTESQKAAAADWLGHMCQHLENAIALSEQLEESQLNEGNDQFWALVKYAENVQECIVQLDNLNKTILPALDEVPLDPIPEASFSWSGMKGMRQRLAQISEESTQRYSGRLLPRTSRFSSP